MVITKKLKSCLAGIALSIVFALSLAGSSTYTYIGKSAKPMYQARPLAATTTSAGYTPAQIRQAYGIDSSFPTGKGKTIAIVTAYDNPTLVNDVNVFSKKFGLPSANITIKRLGGTKVVVDWSLETALDVEWAHALAPSAKLLIVEAASNSGNDLMAAVDYAVRSNASVVSMSWGVSEFKSQIYADSHFNSQNTVFVAASGDDGAGAVWPASSQNVLSVGGTSLYLNKYGTRVTETAWRGSGGGTSYYEAQPAWQYGFIRTYGNKRAAPDVSFNADPRTGVLVYSSANNKGYSGWYVMGGTSLGAPSWAAIIADLNQNNSYIKNPGSLYAIAQKLRSGYVDIVSGNNGVYRAVSGYDRVTGLGSPQCKNLLSGVAKSSIPAASNMRYAPSGKTISVVMNYKK